MFCRSALMTVAELPLRLTCVMLLSDPRRDLTCSQAAALTDAEVVGFGAELGLIAGLGGGAGLWVLVVVVEVVHAAISIAAPTIGTVTATGTAVLSRAVQARPACGCCLVM